MKFDFDDILIQPATISDIESRKEITVNDENGILPIFTAPMDTVVDLSNYKSFLKNVKVILPRTINEYKLPYEENCEYLWFSYSMNEIEELFLSDFTGQEKINSRAQFIQDYLKNNKLHILIDIANGHMRRITDYVLALKQKYGVSLILMVGNVANPETYKLLSEAGADYVRIGIGNGGGCLTTEQTGIGYPMASLVRECYEIACTLNKPAKIVADGGFKKYADIIKALALGADAVMVGSIFNKCLESCADTYTQNIKHDNWTEPGSLVDQYDENTINMFKSGAKYFKKFRGMSTKEVQKSMGNVVLKTSEGITRMNPVEYTLEGWVDNFKHYLSSAMSYTNKSDLKSFIGEVEYNLITQNAFKRYNK